MQVSYGPPGQRGVTTLMAVGDTEDSPDPLESVLVLGAMATGAAVLLGASPKLTSMGALAVAGVGLVTFLRKKNRTVVVTKPAAAGW
jgi:hypothetical protein